MELLPLWVWPLCVGLLALAARLWVGAIEQRGAKRNAGSPRESRGVSRVVPSAYWSAIFRLPPNPFMRTDQDRPETVHVIARKVIGPQHTIVLLGIWDQEIALSVQPGLAPTVLTARAKQSSAQCAEVPEGFPQNLSGAQAATVAGERTCTGL